MCLQLTVITSAWSEFLENAFAVGIVVLAEWYKIGLYLRKHILVYLFNPLPHIKLGLRGNWHEQHLFSV